MTPLLVVLHDGAHLAAPLAAALGAQLAETTLRRFPDGETYLRYDTSPAGRHVVLLCGLDHPDAKLPALGFAAHTARELGAASVGLIAPYLPYMRQDIRFQAGEAITSVHFARWVSSTVDWLVTVDPHLHRWSALSDIYSIPATVARAAASIADWLSQSYSRPLLIGPDAESRQWVGAIAQQARCDFVVLEKTRTGDRDVAVGLPDLSPFTGGQPVLIDDTVSTAATMIAAIDYLVARGWPHPACCAVHALFAGDAHARLVAAGAARIVSCNTIAHSSNAIDISAVLATAARAHLAAAR